MKTTGDTSLQRISSGTRFENATALLSLIQIFFGCCGICRQISKNKQRKQVRMHFSFLVMIAHECTSAAKNPSTSSYGCRIANTLLLVWDETSSAISTSASRFKCCLTESVTFDGSTNKWISPFILTSAHEKKTGLYWISEPRKFSNPKSVKCIG